MKKENFTHLLGKTRKEIKLSLGDGFNYYQDDNWTYLLKRNWFWKGTYLHIYFENDIVVKVDIIKTF